MPAIMQSLAAAHIASFDFAIGEGLQQLVQYMRPAVKNGIELKIHSATVEPLILDANKTACTLQFPLYPSECRVRRTTYHGTLRVTLEWKTADKLEYTERTFPVPIMLKSSACLLRNMLPEELVSVKEEVEVPGGCFIINGKERLFQTFLVLRQNYPIAIERTSWKKKIADESFSKFGVKIRSVRNDGLQSNLTLRYLENGTVKVMFYYGHRYYFAHFMLVARVLLNETDRFFYENLVDFQDPLSRSCVCHMLRDLQNNGVYTQLQAKKYFGSQFSSLVNTEDVCEVTDTIVRESILVNLETDEDKFYMLSYMLKKLLKLVQGEQDAENLDDLRNQELLMGGQLYLMLLRVELHSYLASVRRILDKIIETNNNSFSLDARIMTYCTNRSGAIGHYLERALSTGNIPAAKMGLSQDTGYSLLCESTNVLHFLSYFSDVQKFVYNQYGTTHRKMHPEFWGFLCPIETPSGNNTGITNHLTVDAMVTTSNYPVSSLECLIQNLGVMPYSSPFAPKDGYPVILDGKVCGLLPFECVKKFITVLRFDSFPLHIDGVLRFSEIVFLPIQERSSYNSAFIYPGIFIFTTPGRLMRPVRKVSSGKIQYIGVFEQASAAGPAASGTVYQEITKNLLGGIGSMIPFVEFNQSPKSMHSTNMMKQSLGVLYHAVKWHSDSTIAQLTYPQIPLVNTSYSSYLKFDENYPIGINAVVAVLSYSGYDMEDAIVFNKSSIERGFAHCNIFKTELIDLKEKAECIGLNHAYALTFQRSHLTDPRLLDSDGLPYIGQVLKYGDPYCSYVETESNEYHTETWKSVEPAYVSDVKILGNHGNPKYMTAVLIHFRLDRHPEIGDKFANRHGQKGVLSQVLPAESMPFTSDGLTPDILFNPHGFPSRMTVGMLIEAMAGKGAAVKAVRQCIEPFEFSEERPATEHFGNMLREAGYNFYGTEKMYSGVSGKELECDVFCGVVYYQRLRHMVQDKFQMRSSGKVSFDMQQPIKHSCKDGAVRFGEMERDALLAHGAAFCLQDRFMDCSDKCEVYLCNECGNLLYPVIDESSVPEKDKESPEYQELRVCRLCENENTLPPVQVPYVFVRLCAELSAVNIKIKSKTIDGNLDPVLWTLIT